MAEGNETPGYPGGPPEGPGRRSEGDLFSERRARRAAESGEAALTTRAEAAEATVQTLERHVASLQQRLREAEDERRRMAELLEAEREGALEREHELRRVKQREYAEQQLRVEAEDRLLGAEREGRIEADRVSRRLDDSERSARELSQSLEDMQRQLAEAEQVLAAERAHVRRSEGELRERLSELERRTGEIEIGLAAERSARQQAERLLEGMRDGHRQVAVLVGEVRGILERVIAGAEASGRAPALQRRAPQEPLTRAAPAQAADSHQQERGAEMAQALAGAVERLRERAESAPPPEAESEAAPESPDTPPRQARPVHKHSMSLITRIRIRRKQRRGR